ncbi:TIR domain-containing protein [Acaryochloris sp. CCMEE 5410]|uniref:TIR domain-containing protein n=1 Tax=Acaryochloris sp. CCMEE 5410 TaxID=310037 RepID=UPI0002485109|nr:TIR domain-containing protein [Acaryochloris sp. CCMEE 5410]KAI9129287.1 TIR domain-containing protein [Acaryochloris sp. CCMEE 5410]
MTTQTILFLAANPKDTQPLRLDQELRDIDEGLQRAQHRDEFQLEQRLAVRPRDIQRAMLDLNPQIVHFSGHGEGDEGLVFEDVSGNTQLVSGEAIADLFSLFADQLRCVVLNGCYTEVQAKAISEHIPYVIGMKRAIQDKAAISFAVGFYDALGSGRDVEFAFKLGCAAIRMEGIEDHLTPVLIKKPITEETKNQDQPKAQTPPTPAPSPMSPKADGPLEVFISYSHKDDDLREELVIHLSNLKRQGKIAAWHDRAIEAGEEWETEIKDRLESAQIILLLVSAPFMASDYCYDIEMQRAIDRHNEGTARVIPIILRPCDWQGSPFSKLEVLPKDAKPVTKWADRDEAFLDVVNGIRRAVETLTKK